MSSFEKRDISFFSYRPQHMHSSAKRGEDQSENKLATVSTQLRERTNAHVSSKSGKTKFGKTVLQISSQMVQVWSFGVVADCVAFYHQFHWVIKSNGLEVLCKQVTSSTPFSDLRAKAARGIPESFPSRSAHRSGFVFNDKMPIGAFFIDSHHAIQKITRKISGTYGTERGLGLFLSLSSVLSLALWEWHLPLKKCCTLRKVSKCWS